MTLTLEIENKNKTKNKKDFNRLVNRLGKQLAPTQYPEYKKCVRKNCLKEYKEYEEQLPTQLEKIAKCMFTENREKCFDQYYLPILNPLINCSKNKCSGEMHKLVNKLKQKQKQKSKFKTQKLNNKSKNKEVKLIKPIKEIKTNKKNKYYSESKAENPQESESKQDLSSSEISPEISYQDPPKIKKNQKNQKNIKYKNGDRLKAIFGDQNNHTSTVSLGRLDSQISESTIGMHVESSKN